MRRFKPGKTASDIDAVLRDRVRQAYQAIPLYRRLGRTFQVRPETIRRIHDLPHLPLVTKTDFERVTPENHLRPRALTHKTQVRVTSGTTGWELDIHMSRAELAFRQFIYLRRIWLCAGKPRTIKLAQAGAWIESDPKGEIKRSGCWPISVVLISRQLPIVQQASALAAERPTVVTGCPSALEVIASEMPKLSTDWDGPSLIATRGEILRPQTRRILERGFRCKVIDFYSAEETGLIAWQCPENPAIMHVEGDACVVEVVDPSGEPVPTGSLGDVVVTNLFNRTMPLIRYRIGDQSEIVSRPDFTCSCSHVGTSMRAPFGRPDDFITLPDGERISPRVIDDLVTEACYCVGHGSRFYNSIRDYQIIQESRTQITIHLLTDEIVPQQVIQYMDRHTCGIHPQLQARFVRVSSIDLEETGKRRRVVSLLDHSKL